MWFGSSATLQKNSKKWNDSVLDRFFWLSLHFEWSPNYENELWAAAFIYVRADKTNRSDNNKPANGLCVDEKRETQTQSNRSCHCVIDQHHTTRSLDRISFGIFAVREHIYRRHRHRCCHRGVCVCVRVCIQHDRSLSIRCFASNLPLLLCFFLL